MRSFTALVVLALTARCGPSDAPNDGGSDATTSDVRIDVIVDPSNCVAPGTPNDDRGVGGYCSPGGAQCASSGPGGAPRICTADLSGATAHDWYCTYPCSTSDACGASATCIATPGGTMCVPPACAPTPIDAGSDADAADASDAADALGD